MTAPLVDQAVDSSPGFANVPGVVPGGSGDGGVAADRSGETLRVGYLVNLYPSVSHTFIRREIESLERLGFQVERFSIRRADRGRLVDDADRREYDRTVVLLRSGGLPLLISLLGSALRTPLGLARAAGTAWQLWRRSHVGLLRHVAYLMEACGLAAVAKRCGLRHVHAHFGTNPASVALLAHRICGIPFSFTMHGSACFDAIATMGIGHKVHHASFVVAVSQYGRSQVMRFTEPRLWERVHVVHCGLPSGSLPETPTPVPTDSRLVCVARLSPEKGHLILLEAIRLLAAEGRRFTVALVGDGPSRAMLQEAGVRLGIGTHLEFTGSLDGAGVATQLAAARALVIPSFMEGLPVVAMESFAIARPVIATAVAGVPELVRTGETGWLVPPGDSASLASAMGEALDAPPALLADLARRGRELVARDFTVDREVAKLGRLIAGGKGAFGQADGGKGMEL